MADFNFNADVAARDATGYSRGYTSSKKAVAGLFEDVGNIALAGVKVADQNNIQNITQQIEEGVNTTLNDFGFRTEGNDSTGTPKELEGYKSQLEKVHKAYVSGALKESNFQIRIDALSRSIRAQYPGYQAEIDTILGGTLGRSTANDLRKTLLQEWSSEQDKLDADDKLFASEVSAARKDGVLNTVIPGYDLLVSQGKAPSKTEVRYKLGQYYAAREAIEQEKKELDLAIEQKKVTKEKVSETAYKEGALVVKNVLQASLNDQSVAEIINKFQTTVPKDWKDEDITNVVGALNGLETKVRVQALNMLQDPRYATLDKDTRDEVIKRIMEPIGIIREAVVNKDTGIVNVFKTLTDTQAAKDVAKALGADGSPETAAAQTARKLKVAESLLSPEGRAFMWTNEDVKGETAKLITSIMTSDILGGTAVDDAVRTGSSGVSKEEKPAVVRQTVANGLKILVAPTESVETKGNIIESFFGEGNAEFLDKFSNTTSRTDGRSERVQLFEKMASPEVTKAVLEASKSNPVLGEKYKEFLGRAFTSIFSRDIANIAGTRAESDFMNITYDPKTMQFTASPKGVRGDKSTSAIFSPNPLMQGAGIFYKANEQWKMSSGRKSVDRLNKYLLLLKPAMEGMGIDSQKAATELLASNNVFTAPEGSIWTKIGRAFEEAMQDTDGKTADGNPKGRNPKGGPAEEDIFAEPATPKRKALLDFIGKAEGADYNTMFGGAKLPLTKMTIEEAISMGQMNRRAGGENYSTAIGKYQIIEETLRRAMRGAGLSENDLFSEENQDKLANWIIDNEGGGGTDATKLSAIWASLPKDASGAGTYDGVGANKATVTWEELQAALQ